MRTQKINCARGKKYTALLCMGYRNKNNTSGVDAKNEKNTSYF